MELKFRMTVEGQEAQQADLNLVGETAAYADDRVLWELLRLAPNESGVAKGIIPFGMQGAGVLSGLTSSIKGALVQGGTNDRKVKVLPFRAIIGPTLATPQVEKLRGMRSGYLVGTGTLYTQVTISANLAFGVARCSLLYAAVTPDVQSAQVPRFVKDAATEAVTGQNISVTQECTVVLGTVDGTPAATPLKPALPADAGGTYYIPIAYIYCPSGFGAASQVTPGMIYEIAPVLSLHAATGTAALKPANQQHEPGGTVDTRQGGSVTLNRPHAYLPPTMVGVEERIIALDLVAGTQPASHNDGDVVDNSIDWRLRLFQWMAWAGPSPSGNLATQAPAGTASTLIPSNFQANGARGATTAVGGGQSFVDNTASLNAGTGNVGIAVADGKGVAVLLDDDNISVIGTGAGVAIYVRATDGALVLRKNGNVTHGSIVIWLRATGAYAGWAP